MDSPMKTQLLFLLMLLVLLASCSTTVEQKKKIRSQTLPHNQVDLKNISIEGKITSNYDGTSFSADVKAKVAWIDSLNMKVIGPFGIPLGTVFARNDRFVFYNTMKNQVMSGNPEDMDLESLINVSLKFEDLIHFLRNETPEPPENYEIDDSHKSDNEILFKNFRNEDYIEYVLFSLDNNTITQYQRKLRDGGNLVLNVVFREHGNDNLARKIVFDSPEAKSSLVMELKDIIINEVYNEPFQFPVPKNAEKLIFEN